MPLPRLLRYWGCEENLRFPYTHIRQYTIMSNNYSQPVIDIDPWPNGSGFRGAEEWWTYISRKCETDKLDMLITLAHLSEKVCQLLLTHDRELFDRFQLSPQTTARLCAIHADNLFIFVTVLVEQNNRLLKGGIES
jgi:hypothetical protein